MPRSPADKPATVDERRRSGGLTECCWVGEPTPRSTTRYGRIMRMVGWKLGWRRVSLSRKGSRNWHRNQWISAGLDSLLRLSSRQGVEVCHELPGDRADIEIIFGDLLYRRDLDGRSRQEYLIRLG